MELRARPVRSAARDDGLARRARALTGAPRDGGRARVALHRGVRERQIRPPAARSLAAVALLAGHALARGMERGRVRRSVARRRLAHGRADPAEARPRALGRVPALVRGPGAAGAVGWRG